jgi:hypothetical protein
MQSANFAGRLPVVVLVAASLAVLAGISPDGAGAAPRLNAAVAVGTGTATGGGARIRAICAKRARRATRSMATASAKSRRRRARRARSVRRRCSTRMRRAARSRDRRSRLIRPSADPLVIGIDGGHDDWWSDTIEARAELGAAVTRHEWDPDEPVSSRDELVLAAATEVRTRIHALLGGNDLGDPVHYRDWVLAFIGRYGPEGDFWDQHPQLDESRYAITTIELGNEPYFGEMTPTEYAATVRPTLERIAELRLPVKVILPSYIHGERTTWIDTLYEEIPNLNSLFHAFADHPYWYAHHPAEQGDNGPFERIDTLRARMSEHGAGDKPIYITEYGESTASCGGECVSEGEQAEHLKAMLDAVLSRDDWGVEMISVFQLHDWNTNSSDREEQFGLLRENGSPKPSYSIVRGAMQQYRG